LVRAGVTSADAIRAATTNAVAMLGLEGVAGTIAAGADADLLIVDGDPLQRIGDLSRITHVVRRGELLDPTRLRDRARAGIR
jgi:imidazolonepropionase-like amidohydrolase